MVEFYHTNKVPDFYKCSVCGAKGLKLWRQYNTCTDYLELMCAPYAFRLMAGEFRRTIHEAIKTDLNK